MLYRENYIPTRAKAGAFMAGVAAFMWVVMLPIVVYVTNHR